MRDGHDGPARMIHFRYTKARANQGFDERPLLRARKLADHCAAAVEAVATGGCRDEPAKHAGERRARRRGKCEKHFLGAPRERAFDPADLAIGGVGQRAIRRPPLVKFLEGKLHQGQRLGACNRGVAQDLVQSLAAFDACFEPQAGGCRGQPDHLADLGSGRREQVVLPATGLQGHEGRKLRRARIEVAAQRGDSPDHPGFDDASECGEEAPAFRVVHPLVGKDLLELVDRERDASRAPGTGPKLRYQAFQSLVVRCAVDWLQRSGREQ